MAPNIHCFIVESKDRLQTGPVTLVEAVAEIINTNKKKKKVKPVR